MDVMTAIDRLGGIATKAQLVALGWSGFDLTAAVRRGQIRRVRRAHYATAIAPPSAIAAVRVGGRLAGSSAATTYGLWAGFDTRVHVAVARNASRLRTNVHLGSGETLTPDATDQKVVVHWVDLHAAARECWRVSAMNALRQVVAWESREDAIACIDTARTVCGFSSADLERSFVDAPVAERVLVRRSRPGSDSGPESVVRQRLEARGVKVDQQVTIPGVGRVDMIIRGTRIVIEIDGKAFHSGEDRFENDRRRDSELAALGYVVIRLSFARVFGRWSECEASILQAITLFRNV